MDHLPFSTTTSPSYTNNFELSPDYSRHLPLYLIPRGHRTWHAVKVIRRRTWEILETLQGQQYRLTNLKSEKVEKESKEVSDPIVCAGQHIVQES